VFKAHMSIALSLLVENESLASVDARSRCRSSKSRRLLMSVLISMA